MLARQSSASNGEQQELEREVLDSIFGHEFTELDAAPDGSRRWRLGIEPAADDGACHVALALVAQLPSAYPSVAPLVTIEDTKGLSEGQCDELRALSDITAVDNLGAAAIFAIADAAKDWLTANNNPSAAVADTALDGAGDLQRQGSSGSSTATAAAARQYRGRQRRKKRQEAKRQRKVTRPGALIVGSAVEFMRRNASGWVPAEVIDEPSPGLFSLRLYTGQQMEQVPKDRVRPKRLASRFLPASALSDAVASTQKGAAEAWVPRVLLPSNGQWAQRAVSAKREKGGSRTQFETPQPESAALELEPFSLPALHETMALLARTAVGASAQPAAPAQGRTPAQPARGYRFVDCENVIRPAQLKAFKARLKATRAHCAATGATPAAPLAAFHATPFHSNLDKIIDNGLLAPGDQMSSTGEFLPIAHGASWGPGVYLTPDVDLTSCYGFTDRLGRKQALYCLVAPGVTHLLDPASEEYNYHSWKAAAREALLRQHRTIEGLREHAIESGVDEDTLRAAEQSESQRLRRLGAKETPMETAELVANMTLDHVATLERPSAEAGFLYASATNRAQSERARRYGPKQFVDLTQRVDSAGLYPDGSHTRLAPDRREIIVGSADQILPVLLVTYEPLSSWVNRKDLLLWSDPNEDRSEVYLSRPLLQFCKIVPEGDDKLATAAEQWWSVSLDALAQDGVGTATRMVFVIERTAAEKQEVTAARVGACADVMRQLQPEQTAAVVFGPHGSTTAHFGKVSTPAALVSLADAPLPSGGDPAGLIEGLCAATEIALRKHQAVTEEEHVRAATEAARAVYAVDVPAWTPEQPAQTFARSVVQSCLDRAVEIGDSRAKTQWVDFSVAPESFVQHSDTQPSQNWGLKTSVLQKTEAELTARNIAAQASKRDQLYLLLVVPADGSRHSDREQTADALSLLERYEGYAQRSGLRSLVRVLSIGSTVTLPLVERLKHSLETVETWEPRRVFAAPDAAALPAVTAEMRAALRDVLVQRSVSVEVGVGDRQIGSGFVSCLTRPAKWEMELATTPGITQTLLYQGELPRSVSIDGCLHRVDRSDAAPPQKPRKTEADERRVSAVELHKRQLAMLQSLVTSLQLAAASGRLIDESVRRVRGLLSGIRGSMLTEGSTSSFTFKDLASSTPVERAKLVQERRRLLSDAETCANRIEDTVRVGKARADCADEWAQDLEEQRFGAAALKRVEQVTDFETEFSVEAIVSDLVSFADGKEAVEGQTALQALDAAAASVGMTSSDLAAVRELPRAVDLLSAIGMQGIVVKVQRLAAAAVQPWLVVIDRVLPAKEDSSVVFAAMQSGVEYHPHAAAATDDQSGSYDVVVVADPATDPTRALRLIRSKLHQLYLSVAFTRTPSVPLPGQRLAFLMTAFARITEQLLREKMERKKDFLSDGTAMTLVEYGLQCMFTLRELVRGVGWFKEIGRKLLEADPAAHMTEAEEDNIASVVQVLCSPCLDHVVAEQLFHPTADAKAQLSRVALAMLGEAVSRGCRILVKQQASAATTSNAAEAYRPLLRRALGISAKSCADVTADDRPEPPLIEHSDDFSEAEGNRCSWKFFRASLTNCTPWAVMGGLGWARVVHGFCSRTGRSLDDVLTDDTLREDLAKTLLSAFDDRKTGISTNTFARQHLTSGESGRFPVLVQIALFCQGLRYHNSRLRRDGGLHSLTDPKAILHELAKEEREKVYKDRLAAKRSRIAASMAEEARNDRVARMRLEAAAALESHGAPHLPRLFTPAEVDALNMERPSTDQLEVMPSGLLRHHCCFERCPQYLKNLSTERDRQLGTRHGLYRHFKCFISPDRLYYNGAHNIACTLFGRYRGKPKLFVKAALEAIEGNSPAMVKAAQTKRFERANAVRPGQYLAELLRGIFDQLTEAEARPGTPSG